MMKVCTRCAAEYATCNKKSVFCSRACYWESKRGVTTTPDKRCAFCNSAFRSNVSKSKFCSRPCYAAAKRTSLAEMSQSHLRTILRYYPATGDFFWLVNRAGRGGIVKAGSLAGHVCKSNQVVTIRIDRKLYLAHRLVWLYVHGRWPSHFIDHINLDSCDNRLCNIREATPSQNNMNMRIRSNNRSGVKGVFWSARETRWSVSIGYEGKELKLGRFACLGQASRVRREAQRIHHADIGRVA